MKKALIGLLALTMLFTCGLPAQVTEAKTVQQLQQEKKEYQKKQQDAKKNLEQAKANKESAEQEIAKLDKAVTEAENALAKTTQDLSTTEANLKKSEVELQIATEKKEAQLVAFQDRIKYIYEHGQVGYLQLIFQSQSIQDLLLRMQYVNDIMAYDKNMLADLKNNQEIIQVKTNEIAADKDRLTLLAREQKERNTELTAKRQEKQVAAEAFRKDEAKYASEAAAWASASSEVEALIATSRQQAAATAGQNSGGGAAKGNVTYTGGEFAWPVPGRSFISSGYGTRQRPIGSGTEFHTGYDIPAPLGTNIVAAAGGTVITARYVNGYGNTVMIDHGGGLVTLYGHNSSLVVNVGDKVSAGQTIAKCGSTGLSTGNHLHFEVRKNGKHTSPQPYLGV